MERERQRREQEEQERRENETKTECALRIWNEGACIWDTPAQAYLDLGGAMACSHPIAMRCSGFTSVVHMARDARHA